MRPRWAALAAVAIIAASGCGGGRRARAGATVPRAPVLGSVETGVASWYGHPYHGRRSASGETYDMEKLTAAHRTLPFETWVRVRNLDNAREVTVRITDRGPFVGGRIIDLSRAAAREIAMLGPGTARVELQIIEAPPERSEESLFAVQAGSFQDRGRAEKLRNEVARFGPARLVEFSADPALWRVIVGREPSLESAKALAERVSRVAPGAFVVREDAIPANARGFSP